MSGESYGLEWDAVERPFVGQLAGLGWGYVEGDPDDPARTDRNTFKDVLQEATPGGGSAGLKRGS